MCVHKLLCSVSVFVHWGVTDVVPPLRFSTAGALQRRCSTEAPPSHVAAALQSALAAAAATSASASASSDEGHAEAVQLSCALALCRHLVQAGEWKQALG